MISLCGEYGGLRSEITQADARAYFIRGIRYYCLYGEPLAAFLLDQALQEAAPAALVPQTDAQLVTALNNATIPRITIENAEVWFPTSIAQAYNYAVAEAQRKRAGGTIIDVASIIVTIVAALSRRGTMTEEFIQKTVEACRAQFSRNIVITSDIASMYFNSYTPGMTPADIGQVFIQLRDQTPLTAIKVRTMIEQAEDSGLSTFVIIKDAMMKYQAFPWGVVEALYPGQFLAYRNASVAIAGNPYYAYRHGGMGDAAATKYAVLGWTARSLFIETGDQPPMKTV